MVKTCPLITGIRADQKQDGRRDVVRRPKASRRNVGKHLGPLVGSHGRHSPPTSMNTALTVILRLPTSRAALAIPIAGFG